MRTVVFGATTALLFLAVGCGKPAEEPKGSAAIPLTDSGLVLAESRLGPITAADIDRYILDLAPGKRPDAAGDRGEQYTSIARRIAVNRLVLEEATLVGADQDPQFRTLERRIERNATSDEYLRSLPPVAPITSDEVRAVYDQNLEKYQREEKRRVSHIYKRFRPDSDREQAVAELMELRQRLLAGEHFDLLAREHSDSETRHDGGLVGEFGRGQFTEDFDRVVFALEERQPSKPVVTSDGVHLFMVWDILQERSFDFEETRPSITQELAVERRSEQLREAAAALPQPEERFTPSRQEIGQILRLGDPATVVLRLGDFTLTIAQFQEILIAQRRLLGAKHVPDLPFQLLEDIRHREVIYQYLKNQGADAISQERLRTERDRELVLYFARRKMTSWLERRPDLIQRHYDNNRMRFASALRLRLRVLSIPFTKDGAAVMAKLEAARVDLDAGDLRLEDLASAHGGEVRDLGFASAAQVQATAPKAMRFVFLLQPGEHTPPYVRGKALVMFQVLERQDPQPRPLALVRDRVVQDYLTHYSVEVFEELSTELLEEAEFQVYSERLESLGASG
jgi:parvulin-like peptidyl-prolyl isomerase